MFAIACSKFSVVEQFAETLVAPAVLEHDFAFAFPGSFVSVIVAVRDPNLVDEAELSFGRSMSATFREVARDQRLVLLESQAAEKMKFFV